MATPINPQVSGGCSKITIGDYKYQMIDKSGLFGTYVEHAFLEFM